MTLGEALAVFKRNAQRFYPFIRDEKQWLKDGDAELGPFEFVGRSQEIHREGDAPERACGSQGSEVR